MRSRSALILVVLASFLISGCSQDPPTTPRLAELRLVSGDGQSAPIGSLLPLPLVVRVQDQRGNPISGAVIRWQVTSGTGVVAPLVDTTDADGRAETTFRLGQNLGVQTVSATLTGLSPVSFVATATPAPPSRITIVSGNNQTGTIGTRLPADLTVRVTDAFDNPKAGVTVNYTVISGGGTVIPTAALTDDGGIARAGWTLGPDAGIQSVLVGSGALTPVTFRATALAPPAPAGAGSR
jgi:hypothetical protein